MSKPGKTDPETLKYLDHLQAIADEDVRILNIKDREYGGSWLRRGGSGAYHAGIRKADRLDTSVERYGYDVFKAIAEDNRQEGILDDIRDLRRYLLLWEARAMELQLGPFAPRTISSLALESVNLIPKEQMVNPHARVLNVEAPNPEAEARRRWEKMVTNAQGYRDPGSPLIPDPSDTPPPNGTVPRATDDLGSKPGPVRREIMWGRTIEELQHEITNPDLTPAWFKKLLVRGNQGAPNYLVVPKNHDHEPYMYWGTDLVETDSWYVFTLPNADVWMNNLAWNKPFPIDR